MYSFRGQRAIVGLKVLCALPPCETFASLQTLKFGISGEKFCGALCLHLYATVGRGLKHLTKTFELKGK